MWLALYGDASLTVGWNSKGRNKRVLLLTTYYYYIYCTIAYRLSNKSYDL